MREFTIGKNDAGQRLDRFVAKNLPLLPPALLQKYIRLKRIKVNGKGSKRDVRLETGDILQLYINDEFFDKPNEENLFLTVFKPQLNIVYEDENLLLVDKRPGMSVHADETEKVNTLINHIQAYLYQKREWNPKWENAFAPALCNRIDRNTGGIVIAAKNAKRAQEEQFAQDTLNSVGLGSGIVSSQMLVDQMNGEGGEFIAQRAAADREWTYGHVVVDEAQELTAMDWRMLIRRCPSRSFTIVGDVAQTSALGGTRRWDRTMNRLFGERRWDLNELTINYRNPQEVSDLASDFAQKAGLYISTVNAVRTIPDAVRRIIVDGESDTIATAASHVAQLAKQFVDADGTGRVAVIAPSHMLDPLRSTIFSTLPGTLGQHETNRLSEQHEWDAQISVGSTESVKGLDAVVVVQPGRIEQDAPSRLVAASDLYVAMTRPTQRLVIVRTREDETALQL